MIVMINIATMSTFSCLKNKKKKVYRNDREVLP